MGGAGFGSDTIRTSVLPRFLCFVIPVQAGIQRLQDFKALDDRTCVR